MNDLHLIDHELGYFAEPERKATARDWAEGIVGMAAIVGFMYVLIVLASK